MDHSHGRSLRLHIALLAHHFQPRDAFETIQLFTSPQLTNSIRPETNLNAINFSCLPCLSCCTQLHILTDFSIDEDAANTHHLASNTYASPASRPVEPKGKQDFSDWTPIPKLKSLPSSRHSLFVPSPVHFTWPSPIKTPNDCVHLPFLHRLATSKVNRLLPQIRLTSYRHIKTTNIKNRCQSCFLRCCIRSVSDAGSTVISRYAFCPFSNMTCCP